MTEGLNVILQTKLSVCDDIKDLKLIKTVTGWLPSGSGHMPLFFTLHIFHSQNKNTYKLTKLKNT
jgi:hypothetical protein